MILHDGTNTRAEVPKHKVWNVLWIVMVSQDIVLMIHERNWSCPCGHAESVSSQRWRWGLLLSLLDGECLATWAELLWTRWHSLSIQERRDLLLGFPLGPCSTRARRMGSGSTSGAASHSHSSSLALPMALLMQWPPEIPLSLDQPLSSHDIKLHLC